MSPNSSRNEKPALALLSQAAHHGFTLLVQDESTLRPSRLPVAGEQFRFHFDMTKCIGCKCCVVACQEQNGNPAHLQWRKVGELEGGVYPAVQRLHLSMGCNHCVEPTCLAGCPVQAYSKDALTGIVDHSADTCIGCQYCTWNCSYGVPQYDDQRGVVGKCDMCHQRLNDGALPACVEACPEKAIRIELVNVAEWRKNPAAGNAPGMPAVEDSLSTTRITLPKNAATLQRVDQDRLAPQAAHLSLVLLLVVTQMAIGGTLCQVLAQAAGAALPWWTGLVPAMLTAMALQTVLLHLGRPAHAYRAWRGWRTSWLSREVIALSAYAAASIAYAFGAAKAHPAAELAGLLALATGLAGIYCSAMIYRVKARPAWDMPHTLAEFFFTAAVLGPRLLLLVAGGPGWLVIAGCAGTVAQLANRWLRRNRMANAQLPELQQTATLLLHSFRLQEACFVGLSALSGVLLWGNLPAWALGTGLAAELLLRHLFFTAVVPKQVAATFLTPGRRTPQERTAQEHAA